MSDHEITPLWLAEILAQAPEPYERNFIFAPAPPHIGGMMLTLMDVDYDADPIQRVQSKQLMTVTELRESVLNPSFVFRSLVEKMARDLAKEHGNAPPLDSDFSCEECAGSKIAVVRKSKDVLELTCTECNHSEVVTYEDDVVLEEQAGYRCANCDSNDATAVVDGDGGIIRIVCTECGYDEERG